MKNHQRCDNKGDQFWSPFILTFYLTSQLLLLGCSPQSSTGLGLGTEGSFTNTSHNLASTPYKKSIPTNQEVSPTKPGALRSYSTIYSIGFEWDISGDQDHDAQGTVQYRLQNSSQSWNSAMPLFRVDMIGFESDVKSNMLAGSIFFLEPGRPYEVKLSLTDPDGGQETRTLAVTTKNLPQLPLDGRTWHVVPGSGGGEGTSTNPWKGLQAAQAQAQPGDTFLLHAGDYGDRIVFKKSGTPGNYIVWKVANNEKAIFHGLQISASHVWIEGFHVQGPKNAVKTSSAPKDVVFIRNTVTDCHYCVYLSGGGEGWYISDNIIKGNLLPGTDTLSGEGIELQHTSHHTVSFNRISQTADGISYPHTNVDIFGNDIFNTADDGIELDYGHANNRVWGNRLYHSGHNGISFQPMRKAPWYIFRNQIVGPPPLKLRFHPDQFLLAHNTMVSWGHLQSYQAEMLLTGLLRNNLWISIKGGYIWHANTPSPPKTDWRTDIDFEGFDWSGAREAFKWGRGRKYSGLGAFQSATGLVPHGIAVDKDDCFAKNAIPQPSATSTPPLLLQEGCEAIDRGQPLPNINNDWMGKAPDLGAFEFGKPAPHFGPRPLSPS